MQVNEICHFGLTLLQEIARRSHGALVRATDWESEFAVIRCSSGLKKSQSSVIPYLTGGCVELSVARHAFQKNTLINSLLNSLFREQQRIKAANRSVRCSQCKLEYDPGESEGFGKIGCPPGIRTPIC